MSFHGMDKLVLCSTCSKSKFGIDSVDLKEVPVSLSPWRAGTIVTDLSKAVFSLHCFERECNNRHLRDFSGIILTSSMFHAIQWTKPPPQGASGSFTIM